MSAACSAVVVNKTSRRNVWDLDAVKPGTPLLLRDSWCDVGDPAEVCYQSQALFRPDAPLMSCGVCVSRESEHQCSPANSLLISRRPPETPCHTLSPRVELHSETSRFSFFVFFVFVVVDQTSRPHTVCRYHVPTNSAAELGYFI